MKSTRRFPVWVAFLSVFLSALTWSADLSVVPVEEDNVTLDVVPGSPNKLQIKALPAIDGSALTGLSAVDQGTSHSMEWLVFIFG